MIKKYQDLQKAGIDPILYFNFLMSLGNQLNLLPEQKTEFNEFLLTNFVYNADFMKIITQNIPRPSEIQTPQMELIK